MAVSKKDIIVFFGKPLLKVWNGLVPKKQVICIISVGRSGSTWLSQILNSDKSFREVFEPFHSDYVEEARIFESINSLRRDETHPTARKAVSKIFRGETLSPWSERSVRGRGNKLNILKRKLIVKTIRTFPYISWIKENFHGIHILVLMRNPCAVAVSQRTSGWFPVSVAERDKFADFIIKSKHRDIGITDITVRVYTWCTAYKNLFSELRPDEYFLVRYEDLCRKPAEELQKISGFLGTAFTPDRETLERASFTAVNDIEEVPLEDRALSWKKHVTREEKEAAQWLLTKFGLHAYYREDMNE